MERTPSIARIAHFSDIHFFRPGPWTVREVFSKRLSGSFNYRFLGRGTRFTKADRIVATLRRELESEDLDAIAFTGDSSSFGVDTEIEAAAAALPLHLPGLAVPGNHDYYTPAATKRGSFERCFAPWQAGERVDDQVYPFAQRVGEYWLIGVNSATDNFMFWDARGRVGKEQLERFDALCDRLEGPKILATHYPYLLRKGQPEHPGRQLRDAEDLAKLAAKHGVIAWLHGHRHRSFWLLPAKKRPFTCLCSGSPTHKKRWMYHIYTFTPDSIEIERRLYNPKEDVFDVAEIITIPNSMGAYVG